MDRREFHKAAIGATAGAMLAGSAPAAAAMPGLPHPGDLLPAGARLRLGTNRLNHLVRAGNPGVCRVAFSACGRYLLGLGYQDDCASLWEVPHGREVWRRELGCHVDRGAGVAFSPDGRLVVIGGHNALKVFDLATGNDVRTLRDGWPGADALAFSACGRYLAEARYDGRVDVWAVGGWRVVATVEGEPDPVHDGSKNDHFAAVAFSPDGKLLAAGSHYHHYTFCTRREYKRLMAEAKAAQRSIGGGQGVDEDDWHVSEFRGRVWVWDWAAGTLVNRLEGPQEAITAVTFLPDRTVAAGAQDETLRVWDVTSGQELRCHRWGEHGSNPFPVAFRPDGRAAAVPAATRGDCARVLDLATGAELRRFDYSYYVDFSPDGRMLATAAQGRCHLWDLATGADLAPTGRHCEEPNVVRFSDDGRRVLSAEYHGDAFLWDAATGGLIAAAPRELPGRSGLALSPDGQRVAGYHGELKHEYQGGPKAAHLYVWDVAAATVRGFVLKVEPRSIAWAPDCRGVVVAAKDGAMLLHPLRDDRPTRAIQTAGAMVEDMRPLPDGRLVGATRTELCVWDLAAGEIVTRIGLPDLNHHYRWYDITAVSPDDRSVALLGQENVLVARLDRREVHTVFTLPEDFEPAACGDWSFTAGFLADGQVLVSSAGTLGDPEEGPFAVRVWDGASGRQLWQSPPSEFAASVAAFSADGRSLATGTHDGTTLIWDLRPVVGTPRQT